MKKITHNLEKLNLKKSLLLPFIAISFILISCDWSTSGKQQENNFGDSRDDHQKKAPDNIVDVSAMDYAFGMPEEIPSGWVKFRMKNMGNEEHVGIIVKFQDTVTYSNVTDLIQKLTEEGTLEAYYKVIDLTHPEADGGPGLLSPGLTSTTTTYLDPGLYALVCGIQSADGLSHFQRGMVRAFKVLDKKGNSVKPEGTVDVTVSDYAISTHDPIETGEQVFNVRFSGKEEQDIHLARLRPDQDLQDLQNFMDTIKMPSPFEFLGGIEQNPQKMKSSFKVHLEPGRYAFVSHHFTNVGMTEEFTVSENKAAPPIENSPANPEVVITSNMSHTTFPDKVPTGRTEFILRNDGAKEYKYLLAGLKKGFSEEQFINHILEVYRDEKDQPENYVFPDNPFFYRSLKPGEEVKFNFEVKQGSYFMIGPLLVEPKWKEQWREENLIHKFTGVGDDL